MALLQARMMAGSVVGMLVAMGIAVFVVQGPDSDPLGTPPVWLLGAQLVGGVALHVVLEGFGYRARPVPPGTPVAEATTLGLRRFQSLLVVRMALAEVIALASLAAAFVLGPPDGILGYLAGAFVSLLLVLAHVWPWHRPIEKTRAALEREGALVPLPDALGLSGSTGAIQEL